MKLLTALFVFSGLLLQAQTLTHDEVREMYFEGWEGQCGATELHEKLTNYEMNDDLVLLAYKGAVMTTVANCKNTPFSKLSMFNKGKDLLESALNASPENIEIRFLRYTVQTNIPDILKYDNMEADKQFLLESLTLHQHSVDDSLEIRIASYLMEHGKLSDTEKSKIQLILAEG